MKQDGKKIEPKFNMLFRYNKEVAEAIEKISKTHPSIKSKNDVVILSILKVANSNINIQY